MTEIERKAREDAMELYRAGGCADIARNIYVGRCLTEYEAEFNRSVRDIVNAIYTCEEDIDSNGFPWVAEMVERKSEDATDELFDIVYCDYFRKITEICGKYPEVSKTVDDSVDVLDIFIKLAQVEYTQNKIDEMIGERLETMNGLPLAEMIEKILIREKSEDPNFDDLDHNAQMLRVIYNAYNIGYAQALVETASDYNGRLNRIMFKALDDLGADPANVSADTSPEPMTDEERDILNAGLEVALRKLGKKEPPVKS